LRLTKESRSVGPQCINNVAFLILPKRTRVHVANRCDVIGTFFSDLNQHVKSFVSALEKLGEPLKLINRKRKLS